MDDIVVILVKHNFCTHNHCVLHSAFYAIQIVGHEGPWDELLSVSQTLS